MSDLRSRVLTGALFGLTMISINWLPVWGVVCFFGLLVALSSIEFSKLLNQIANVSVDVVFSCFSALLFYVVISLSKFLDIAFPLYFTLILVFFILLLFELWRNIGNALLNVSGFVLHIFYCVVPYYLMMDLVVFSSKNQFNFPLFLGLLLIIWLNDTMAYFVGRYFGKNLIFKRISPKKTWEGTFGGILFGLIGAFIISQINNEMPIAFWIISALLILPMSILGDFFESMLKRSAKIKDSGSILPGHGGVLDRFDSLTFATPVFYFWVILFFNYIET